MKLRNLTGAALLAFAAFTMPVNAQAGDASPAPTAANPLRMQMVTQSIVAVCTNKSAGDACSFSAGTQTISGTCSMSHSGRMFCRPGKPPQMTGAPSGGAPPKDQPANQ